MFIRVLGFLSIFLFFMESLANPFVFNPNFNGQSISLPKGRPLMPLCTHPGSPLCINQWAYQAVPMAVNRAGMGTFPRMHLFVPTFLPSRVVPGIRVRDKNWNTYSPPSLPRRVSYPSVRRRSRNRTSGKNRSEVSVKSSAGTKDNVLDKESPDSQNQNENPLISDRVSPSEEESPEAQGQIVDDKMSEGEVRSVQDQREGETVQVQRVIQIHNKYSDRARIIDTDAGGNLKVTEGQIAYVMTDDIERTDIAETGRELVRPPEAIEPEKITDPRTPKTLKRRTEVTGLPEATSQQTPNVPLKEGDLAQVPKRVREPRKPLDVERQQTKQAQVNAIEPVHPPEATGRQNQQASVNTGELVNPDDATSQQLPQVQVNPLIKPEKTQAVPLVQTRRDTIALPVRTKEVKPGCFIIDKQEETEAGFCFHCTRHKKREPVLSSLFGEGGFTQSMFEDLKKTEFEQIKKECEKSECESLIKSECENLKKSECENLKKSKCKNLNNLKCKLLVKKLERDARKILQGKTVITADSITKICSPEESLKAIIDQFTCPKPYSDFKTFFKKAYCKSCTRGIAPEIMLAMMSIESTGNCKAAGDEKRSVGLFQINSKEHKCYDYRENRTYEEGTQGNVKCLKDPINNMNKSIDVLIGHYTNVNPDPPPTGQCKPWLKMTDTERKWWRRGVSAYNSGSEWVLRAIKSVRNTGTLTSTGYLEEEHRRTSNKKYKEDPSSWEDLRVYYFIEKLSPRKSKTKDDEDSESATTGRRLDKVTSNVAHTEAVLGRRVKGSPPGMVEIWGQYIKKNKPSCD